MHAICKIKHKADSQDANEERGKAYSALLALKQYTKCFIYIHIARAIGDALAV